MLQTGRHIALYSVFSWGLLFACFPALAANGADNEQTESDFHRIIAPILAGNCLECHSASGQGGLDLRSAATGYTGKSGAVLKPGDPEASLLYQYVSQGEMPPKKPLAAEDVAAIHAWILDGAYLPETPLDLFAISTDKRAGYDWWAFQPLAAPEVPDEASHPIDFFVQARLEEAGLAMSAPATPRALIRRATYDLTGLPPTPEEIDAFLADCAAETGSPDKVGDQAYTALLDRLLASDRYGEHWARHWLDVIRYGESNGYERNVLFDNIWPFRDYVIRSFIEDKPISRMILEHLAGDAIGANDPEVEVGLTFLVSGPYDDVGNQDPARAAQIRADAVDEMIRTTSEAFLGLTVGCARCHDHKFDPIGIADYYQFYSVFNGVFHGDREVASSEMRKNRAEQLAPLQAERTRLNEARQLVVDAVNARATEKAPALEATWTREPVSRFLTEEDFEPVEAIAIRLISEGRDDNPHAITDFKIDEFEVWSADSTPRNVALATSGARAEGASRVAEDFADAYEPGLSIDGVYGARWIASGPELVIHFARPERIRRISFSSDRNQALSPTAGETHFVGEYRIEVTADDESWVEVANSRDRKPVNDAHRQKRLYDHAVTAEETSEIVALDRDIQKLTHEINQIPPLPRLRVGHYHQQAPEQPIFLGGDPGRPGDRVQPESLAALDNSGASFTLPPDAPEQERRLQFARWLIHRENPLPARVWANRIWHYHFGTGIVASPSDFGFMGLPPSHPELLEWLASELQSPGFHPEGGSYHFADSLREAWRFKRMHRIIMQSKTYRQATDWSRKAAAIDSESRLLWRFPPRRLRAEEVRDGILQMAGVLNTAMGGPGFRLYHYLNDNVSTYEPLDQHGPETYRRAIYHQQARAMHVDLLTDFDAPDCAFSVDRRVTTTTPLQALTLLNHAFTMDMARALAARLAAEAGDDVSAQVDRAYRLAFGRPVSDEEVAEALPLIERHGMAAFCRALLNANEMLYLQ